MSSWPRSEVRTYVRAICNTYLRSATGHSWHCVKIRTSTRSVRTGLSRAPWSSGATTGHGQSTIAKITMKHLLDSSRRLVDYTMCITFGVSIVWFGSMGPYTNFITLEGMSRCYINMLQLIMKLWNSWMNSFLIYTTLAFERLLNSQLIYLIVMNSTCFKATRTFCRARKHVSRPGGHLAGMNASPILCHWFVRCIAEFWSRRNSRQLSKTCSRMMSIAIGHEPTRAGRLMSFWVLVSLNGASVEFRHFCLELGLRMNIAFIIMCLEQKWISMSRINDACSIDTIRIFW